jgi:hypothetical protein
LKILLRQISPVMLFFVAGIFHWQCTENPFSFGDEISTNTIRGRVELSDHASPDNILVWFSAFDISTRTDENGDFSLSLPSSSARPEGGIDGFYNLYFYAANYRIDSVQIPIFNGNVQYSNAMFNDQGELYQTIRLSKILDIRATIDPVSIQRGYSRTINITFNVQAPKDEVFIEIIVSNPLFKGDPQYMVGFLKQLSDDDPIIQSVYRKDRGFRTVEFKIGVQSVELLPLGIIEEPGRLPTGTYEVIPYLVVHQSDLPEGLMRSIGENVERFHTDFLKIPLKVRNNRFYVL